MTYREIAARLDGLLVMPPYLLTPEPAGQEAHYRALAGATRVGLILYQRDNAVFSPASLVRLADGRVAQEYHYLGDLGERIRDVGQGPDGHPYLLTDQSDGRILRVIPAPR